MVMLLDKILRKALKKKTFRQNQRVKVARLSASRNRKAAKPRFPRRGKLPKVRPSAAFGRRGVNGKTQPRPAEPPVMPPRVVEPVTHAPEVAEAVATRTPQAPTLQLYLREIGQVKLLTPQEEIVLAKRIRKGDEAAREHMIKANLRLVVKIARDYEGLGLPLLDLINEGNIGLMKGVERFDPTKGAKLATYAAWWIKQSIKRALANQSKTIRLPVHVVDKLFHLRKAEARLQDLLGREPTDEELGQELDITALRI